MFKIIQKKFKILINQLSRKCIDKSGFTLIEMSIAVGVVALMMTSVTTFIAFGFSLQKEADRLRLAVVLTQGKLSQLLARPDLDPAEESGEIEKDNSLYGGFKYKIKITNEEIDLAKVAETGSVSFAPVKDKIPEDITNASKDEKMGQGAVTQTGGLVEVMKVVVTIDYPRDDGTYGSYSVITFRKKNKSI